MAKKKSRRRRVGAAALNPASPIVQLGSVAVGYLMADTINDQIDKAAKGTAATVSESTSKIIGAAEVGLGSLLVLGKKKSMLKTVAGGVLAGAGAKRLLKNLGILSGYRVNGYQAVPVLGRTRMNGYQAVPVLGTAFNPSGIGSQARGINGAGYMVNGGGDGTARVMGNASGSGLMHESGSALMN